MMQKQKLTEQAETTGTSEGLRTRIGSASHDQTPPGTAVSHGASWPPSELGSKRPLGGCFLPAVGLTLVLVAGAVLWYWLSGGVVFGPGKLAWPQAIGPIGDFFAGTLGVAGTLAAAFLGLKLAENAVRIARSDRDAALAEDQRDIERFVREEVRTTATKFEEVARAYVEVFSGAASLHSLGRLRDNHAKETIPKAEERLAALRSQLEAIDAQIHSGATAALQREQTRVEALVEAEEEKLAQARRDDADLILFPKESYDKFVEPMRKLAASVEELYWHVPARSLVEQRFDAVKTFLDRICQGYEEPPFPLPHHSLLPFAVVHGRKANQAKVELPFVESVAAVSRDYDRYVEQVVGEAYGRLSPSDRASGGLQAARAVTTTASIALCFWSTTIGGERKFQANWGFLMLLLIYESLPSNEALRSHCRERFDSLAGASITKDGLHKVIDDVLTYFDLDDWKREFNARSLLTDDEIRQVVFYDSEVTSRILIDLVKARLAATRAAREGGSSLQPGLAQELQRFEEMASRSGFAPEVWITFELTQAWKAAQTREAEDEALSLAAQVHSTIEDASVRTVAASVLAGAALSHWGRILASGQSVPAWLMGLIDRLGDALPEEDQERYREAVREIGGSAQATDPPAPDPSADDPA